MQMVVPGAAVSCSVAVILRSGGTSLEPGRGWVTKEAPHRRRRGDRADRPSNVVDLAELRRALGTDLGVAIGAARPRGSSLSSPAGSERAATRDEAGVELPSAEIRALVQSPQNGCVTDAMTPISPAPSR